MYFYGLLVPTLMLFFYESNTECMNGNFSNELLEIYYC